MMTFWAGWALLVHLLVGGAVAQPDPVAIGLDEIVITAGNEQTRDPMGIFVLKVDGSDLRLLAHDPAYESMWARISPDRTQIVFHRSAAGKINELNRYQSTSIWLMKADGSDLREIRPAQTDGWVLQGHVEWAPNGRELLVFAREDTNSPTSSTFSISMATSPGE